MLLNTSDIEKIAALARLDITPDDAEKCAKHLSNILQLVAQMQEVNTDGIEPMAHPLELAQRLREDCVTEVNQREAFQKIAPAVEAGLYLVPQVIE